MAQIALTRTSTQQKQKLSLNIRNVDDLFPGFTLGDFAVIHGSPTLASLASLLCIRAQLPSQLGGLNSHAIYIDCADTFNQDQICRQAKIHHLDPKQSSNKIHLAKAFSAFEVTSFILERLKGNVEKYNAKVIVISNMASLFNSKDLPEEEARSVYSQIMGYLQNFAQEKKVILIVTYLLSRNSTRDPYLQAATFAKANVIISISQTTYDREFTLEKHPHLVLGTAEYPFENLTLNDFIF